MPTGDIDLLVSVFFKTNRFIHKYMYKHKIMSSFSFLQFLTLKYVSDEDEPSMKDVAGFLSIKPASATSIINILTESGLLKRIPDENDRRIVRLQITKEGRKKIEDNFKHAKKGLIDIFSKLEEKDRENLVKIFTKLSKILSSSL